MLTQTSETAIKILVCLARREPGAVLAPRTLAEWFDASPSYVAKITGLLVRGGILRAHRGAHGGVELIADPAALTLLEVVEVCQGRILPDYCQEHEDLRQVCAFHEAMNQLHDAIVGSLSGWTLEALAARPAPARGLVLDRPCRMAGLCRETPEPETP